MGKQAEKLTIPKGSVVTCVADGRQLVLDRESTVTVYTRKMGNVYYVFNAKLYRFKLVIQVRKPIPQCAPALAAV